MRENDATGCRPGRRSGEIVVADTEGGSLPAVPSSTTGPARGRGAAWPLLFLALACRSGPAIAQERGGLNDEEFQALSLTEAYGAMRPPRNLQFSAGALEHVAGRAEAAWRSLAIDEVDPTVHYSVVLQVGHYPRTTGATGSQGRLINEQQGAALVAESLSEKLDELGIRHVLIGADSYKGGEKRDGRHYFKTDVFLSLHMDGATRPCRVGPSLGYNPKFGKESMQYIGLAVAIALRLNARDFMRDNYTESLAHFYSYGHSDTQIAEGIVEMSELSCPADEENFLRSADQIASNIATGLTFMLGERR